MTLNSLAQGLIHKCSWNLNHLLASEVYLGAPKWFCEAMAAKCGDTPHWNSERHYPSDKHCVCSSHFLCVIDFFFASLFSLFFPILLKLYTIRKTETKSVSVCSDQLLENNGAAPHPLIQQYRTNLKHKHHQGMWKLMQLVLYTTHSLMSILGPLLVHFCFFGLTMLMRSNFIYIFIHACCTIIWPMTLHCTSGG